MSLATLLLATALTSGAYHPPDAMAEALRALAAAHPELARAETIGQSTEGRPLMLLTLGAGDAEVTGRRPALLLVGALRGEELLGAEVCLASARALLARDDAATLLAERTVYVLPHANPDAVARRLPTDGSPAQPVTGTLAPWDGDGDFDADEDAPRDIDDDGVIAWMRWRDPEGTWIVDPDCAAAGDARYMRPADPAKGERGVYRVAREGVDTDGDDRWAEDGPGGIDLCRSFPQFYAPLHEERGAGPHQLGAPEARAIADLLVSRRNIASARVLRTGGNIACARVLRTGGGGGVMGDAPQPLVSGEGKLDDAEASLYRELLDAVRERVGDDKRPGPFDNPKGSRAPGSLQDWLVFGHGIVSLAERLWHAPPAPEPQLVPEPEPVPAPKPPTATATPETPTATAAPRAPTATASPEGPAPPTGTAAPEAAPPAAEAAPPAEADKATKRKLRWLRWSDRALDGEGFIPWHPVAHPTLGEVEVGGWRPFTVEDLRPRGHRHRAVAGAAAAHRAGAPACPAARGGRLPPGDRGRQRGRPADRHARRTEQRRSAPAGRRAGAPRGRRAPAGRGAPAGASPRRGRARGAALGDRGACRPEGHGHGVRRPRRPGQGRRRAGGALTCVHERCVTPSDT
jgi:hypothetical protein